MLSRLLCRSIIMDTSHIWHLRHLYIYFFFAPSTGAYGTAWRSSSGAPTVVVPRTSLIKVNQAINNIFILYIIILITIIILF